MLSQIHIKKKLTASPPEANDTFGISWLTMTWNDKVRFWNLIIYTEFFIQYIKNTTLYRPYTTANVTISIYSFLNIKIKQNRNEKKYIKKDGIH